MKSNNQFNSTWPVVIDSLPETEKVFYATNMTVPRNDIEFIGEFADTIPILRDDLYIYEPFIEFQYLTDSVARNINLKLVIDTNFVVTIDLEKYSPPPPPVADENKPYEYDSIKTAEVYKKWNQRPRNYVQAFPTYILNCSNDTIFLDQQDLRVLMIQEAKDENGIWKPIEYWSFSSCGNSYGAIGILPKNFALIKVIRYSGDYETDIRLKLKNGGKLFYSDSFKGKINKKQFKLPQYYDDSHLTKRLSEEDYLKMIFLNY